MGLKQGRPVGLCHTRHTTCAAQSGAAEVQDCGRGGSQQALSRCVGFWRSVHVVRGPVADWLHVAAADDEAALSPCVDSPMVFCTLTICWRHLGSCSFLLWLLHYVVAVACCDHCDSDATFKECAVHVLCRGANSHGQLGYGTSDSGSNPVPRVVESMKGRALVAVAAAKYHTGAAVACFPITVCSPC